MALAAAAPAQSSSTPKVQLSPGSRTTTTCDSTLRSKSGREGAGHGAHADRDRFLPLPHTRFGHTLDGVDHLEDAAEAGREALFRLGGVGHVHFKPSRMAWVTCAAS
jgi:hypothetical protein